MLPVAAASCVLAAARSAVPVRVVELLHSVWRSLDNDCNRFSDSYLRALLLLAMAEASTASNVRPRLAPHCMLLLRAERRLLAQSRGSAAQQRTAELVRQWLDYERVRPSHNGVAAAAGLLALGELSIAGAPEAPAPQPAICAPDQPLVIRQVHPHCCAATRLVALTLRLLPLLRRRRCWPSCAASQALRGAGSGVRGGRAQAT